MNYLDSLNPEQKKAVLKTEGPLLVLAGAGTGKTKTLTTRILHMIKNGTDPYHILAITFTNKAAKEMRERVQNMLPDGEFSPTLCTFHSLGVRILRRFHQKVGVSKYFKILDQQESMSLIKEAMKKHSFDTKEWEPRKVYSAISRAKSKGQNPQDYKLGKNPLSSVVAIIWPEYKALKKAEGSMDFDDLLLETYNLLKNDESVLRILQEEWRYILVDEYQDTNDLQNDMVRLIAGERQNLCVVGDGDQNIYSWRGANIKNILDFEKNFPSAETIILEKNYRSTKMILSAADQIISKNSERVDKKLITDNGIGDKLHFYEAFSGKSEASWLARKVKSAINSGIQERDIAVLFRTNFQSRLLEESFLRSMIPYQVVGVKFFSRKEIKDIMSYLRAALNPDSLSDIKRVINEPKRGIGKVSIAKIFAGDKESLSKKAFLQYENFMTLLENIRIFTQDHQPSETIKFIIEKSGFAELLLAGNAEDAERLENMKELVTYTQKYDGMDDAYEVFLEEVALLSDQDSLGSNSKDDNSVKLMTIHASKGLEFKYVFVVGLEQGLFPSQRDDAKSKHEAEEERRLCYVAFTRAKERLHLSYAKLRTIFGQQRINEPSEFIRDLDESLFELNEETSIDDSGRLSGSYYDDSGEEITTSFLDF